MSFRPCLQAGGGNPSVRVTLTGGSKIAWLTACIANKIAEKDRVLGGMMKEGKWKKNFQNESGCSHDPC